MKLSVNQIMVVFILLRTLSVFLRRYFLPHLYNIQGIHENVKYRNLKLFYLAYKLKYREKNRRKTTNG